MKYNIAPPPSPSGQLFARRLKGTTIAIMADSTGNTMDANTLLNHIEAAYADSDAADAPTPDRVARTLYPTLPSDDEQLIELFDALVSTGKWRIFWLVTQWIKRRELYQLDHFDYYEKWLYEHIDAWGKCDVFCYRVLNPMVERHPSLFANVLKWADSPDTYVRRAAPVSLLESGRSFRVNRPLDDVLTVVEKLKDDREIHVQKAVGWLLKYTYLSYPAEVTDYLRDNVDTLPRVTFRYALEKTPAHVREELMAL